MRKTLGSHSFAGKFYQSATSLKISALWELFYRIRKRDTLSNSILGLIDPKIKHSQCNHRCKNPYQNPNILNLDIYINFLKLYFIDYTVTVVLICPPLPSSTHHPILPQAIPAPLFMPTGHVYKFFGYPISCTVLYIPMATP